MVESPVDAGLSAFFGPVDLVGCKPPTQNPTQNRLARIGMGRKRTAASKGTSYPGVYWYETKGGRLFRCSWVSSNGETEWAYGFASALDAHKHRSAMVAAADAGQRIATRQAFEV